jgi:hypothetical protein
MKDWAIRLVSLGLALMVVAGGLWWASRSLTQAPPKLPAAVQPNAAANGGVSVGPAAPLAPPNTGLYRCDTPQGVEYRNSPCPTGKQAAVNVVIPQGYDSRPVYNPAFQHPVQRAPEQAAMSAAQAPAQSTSPRATCESLDAAIRAIDAKARQGLPAWRQDQLRADRHAINAQKSASGCR